MAQFSPPLLTGLVCLDIFCAWMCIVTRPTNSYLHQLLNFLGNYILIIQSCDYDCYDTDGEVNPARQKSHRTEALCLAVVFTWNHGALPTNKVWSDWLTETETVRSSRIINNDGSLTAQLPKVARSSLQPAARPATGKAGRHPCSKSFPPLPFLGHGLSLVVMFIP